MATIDMSLTMPAELGAIVAATEDVQAAIHGNPDMKVLSTGSEAYEGGAFQDFGATLLLILGTAGGAAAVTGIFSVIKTAIIEAHKTRRQLYAQRHDLRKILLSVGLKRIEIDLSQEVEEIERVVNQAGQEAEVLPG